MKKIAELTDMNLLGQLGEAHSAPRYKVRAILRNSVGKYAVMYEDSTGLYSLPGGSVESGEDILTALKREMLEETGCTCDVIYELGYIYENRAYCDLQQYSYFFTVTTTGPSMAPAFTSEETDVGTKLMWCTLEEMVSLIENGKPNTNQQIYLKARDTAVLKEYLHRSIREQNGAFRPVTEQSHKTILRELLSDPSITDVCRILDAGSGKTSLSTIISCFPKASVDAIVYPGDERKLKTIRNIQSDQVNVVEWDICDTPIPAHYDLVVAHLLLGEASKFGNAFQDLLQNVLSIQSRYYIIIDYLEDPKVDADVIRTYCEGANLKIQKYTCVENSEPQVWADFVGTHNFGFLIERYNTGDG